MKNYATQASLEDLQEVKDSVQNLLRENGKCCPFPVHEAAMIGAVKLMVAKKFSFEFIIPFLAFIINCIPVDQLV